MHYRLKKIAHMASGKILDIGYAAYPNPFLHGEVCGLDIEAAPKPTNYSRTITMDATRLSELNECFDTVIAGEVIEHLDRPLQFLKGCFDVLSPGGLIIISTPNPYHPPMLLLEVLQIRKYYYDMGHVNIFLPRFLMRLMERAGFKDVKTYSGGMTPPFMMIGVPFPRAWSEIIIYTGQK